MEIPSIGVVDQVTQKLIQGWLSSITLDKQIFPNISRIKSWIVVQPAQMQKH